jgi:hypothetical protein
VNSVCPAAFQRAAVVPGGQLQGARHGPGGRRDPRELPPQDVRQLGRQREAPAGHGMHGGDQHQRVRQLRHVAAGTGPDRAQDVSGPAGGRHDQHLVVLAQPGDDIQAGLVTVVVQVQHDHVRVNRAGARQAEPGRGGHGRADLDVTGLGEYRLQPAQCYGMVVHDRHLDQFALRSRGDRKPGRRSRHILPGKSRKGGATPSLARASWPGRAACGMAAPLRSPRRDGHPRPGPSTHIVPAPERPVRPARSR